MSGLEDFRKSLQPIEEAVCREAAARLQATNRRSLAERRGPGGDEIADNNPKYAKRKGTPLGVLTGGMVAGMVEPGAVSYRFGARFSEIFVPVTSTPHVKKAVIFIAGQGKRERWISEELPSGKRKCYKVESHAVPPRDFVGIDERDLEAVGEKALDDTLRAWGFS